MTPEGKVKKAVKELLQSYEQMWFNMPVPTGYGEPMLDFVGCHRGWAFAIETKAEGEELTPRQQYTRGEMLQAGMMVFVIGERAEKVGGTIIYSGMSDLKNWLDSKLPT